MTECGRCGKPAQPITHKGEVLWHHGNAEYGNPGKWVNLCSPCAGWPYKAFCGGLSPLQPDPE